LGEVPRGSPVAVRMGRESLDFCPFFFALEPHPLDSERMILVGTVKGPFGAQGDEK